MTRMEVSPKMAIPFVAFRMRWLGMTAAAGVLVLALVAVLGTGIKPAPTRAAAAVPEKVGSSLASLAADRPDKRTEVIVRMATGESPAAGRALVERSGGRAISKDIQIINGFAARLRAGDAARIAKDGRVEAVSLNAGARVRTLLPEDGGLPTDTASICPASDSTSRSYDYGTTYGRDPAIGTALNDVEGVQLHSTRTDQAWAAGASGKGVGVAVIDTGIAGEQPDFRATRSSNASRVIASAVTNPCAKGAADNYGHGTHVAGLIAGNSLMLRDWDRNYARYMGVAPNANLVSVKVADEDGATTVLDVINGLQFAVDKKDAFNIRVINMSLSSTVAESYRTDPLDAAAEAAWNAGIVVVAAAGNEGTADNAVSFAPGNDPFVVSVGAVDDQGTRRIDDDRLADWSSRGKTQDGFRKPEVLAPGAHLASTTSPGSDLWSQCDGCRVGDHYFRMGGTSMSAALVSGVAALVVEKHPEWKPNQVKGAIQSTLRNVIGTGAEVNAQDALYATNLGSNTGLVANDLIDATTGQIDWARASFRRASFRDASGSPLDPLWSRASFRCDCGLLDGGVVDPARASFRRASFRKTIGFNK